MVLDEVERWRNPSQTNIIDVCGLLDEDITKEKTVPCQWEFPIKYRGGDSRREGPYRGRPKRHTLHVPLSDMNFYDGFTEKPIAIFYFGYKAAQYYSGRAGQALIDSPKIKVGDVLVDPEFNRGYFTAFDGQMVFFSYRLCTISSLRGSTLRIIRLLGDNASIDMWISIPRFADSAVCADYAINNVYEIDQKLMFFLGRFQNRLSS